MNKKLINSVLLLLALGLSSCNKSEDNKSKEPEQSIEPPIIDNSGFKNINEDEVFEIHTEEQKTFLEYDEPYAKMDKSLFPDGSEHLSDSKPITLTWDYELPEGKELSKYSIIYGQEKDLSDGYKVDADINEDKISFNNPFLGRNYYKLIATFTDESTDETPIRHFEVDSSYPRNLTIEGMTNCRDIGGRTLEDGGKIKQGLIYRTSGKNQNGSLTDATSEEMINHLGVKNEINLAGDSNSYNLELDGTTLISSCRMDTSSSSENKSSHHLSRNTEAVKNFFNIIADSDNYPLFYHCKIGTDRTGVCTILLQGLLGVSLNEIYQDYLFSNFGKIGEQRTIGDGNSHDIKKYMDDFMLFSGEKFQNKVYNILLSIGVARETLDAVISNLTEGQEAKGNDAHQVIGEASKLEASNVTIVNDNSDRDHPDHYYVLDASNKEVSLSFKAEKNYTAQVIAYLGTTDISTSKKIGDAISCDVDGNDLTINDISYYDARMGVCRVGSTSRMNYWPIILGTVDLDAGDHTVSISYKGDKMNLGGIYLFDNATAGGLNGFED